MQETPGNDDQHESRDPDANDSHGLEPHASGDAFAHWGSGLLLAFTMGCLFLNDLWISILWSNDKPLGTWGLALPPLLGVLAPIALVARRAGVSVREQIWLYGLSARQLFAVVLVALGAVPVCYAAGALNAIWAPPDPEYFEFFQTLAPTSVSSALGGFLAVVVCVPLGEEVLFRVLLLGLLARHVHAVTAVVATGVLFAAAHLAPFLLLPIGVLGIVLGLLTIWSRTLTAAWIGHAVFNLFGYVELSATGDANASAVEQYALHPAVFVVGTAGLVGGLALLRADALSSQPRALTADGHGADTLHRGPGDEAPHDDDAPQRRAKRDDEETTRGEDYFKD